LPGGRGAKNPYYDYFATGVRLALLVGGASADDDDLAVHVASVRFVVNFYPIGLAPSFALRVKKLRQNFALFRFANSGVHQMKAFKKIAFVNAALGRAISGSIGFNAPFIIQHY
jgi:hypothetical protein